MARPERKILPEGDFPQPGDPGYSAGKAEIAVIEANGQVLAEIPLSDVQKAAAKLLGQGLENGQVARILLEYLAPKGRTDEQKMTQARGKLRRWQRNPAFRDLIYQQAVVKTDLALPAVLGGIVQKAKRGRVDAARLALELTGRHNPKGDQAPTNITVQIANIPRPEPGPGT